MGIKQFLINIFSESVEDLEQELTELNDAKKSLQIKLKSKKKGFLTQSKEEIKEDIKNIGIEIKELKVKIKKLGKTNIKSENKFNYLCTISIALVIIIALFAFNYFTNNKPACNDIGDNNIGCITISEPGKTDIHTVSFIARNYLDKEAKCSIVSELVLSTITISKRTHELGNFLPNEIRSSNIDIELPKGDADFDLTLICTENI